MKGSLARRADGRKTPEDESMKKFARILLVVSVLMILSGIASCHHYYTVSLPPEAYQLGWDGEEHWEGLCWMKAAVILLAGGAALCLTGFYLREKTKIPPKKP